MIINIAVPANAKALKDSAIRVVNVVPAEDRVTLNLRLPGADFANNMRVFIECEGARREFVEAVNPSSLDRTMSRIIISGLNTTQLFVDKLDEFEQRILGLLLVGNDCVPSARSLTEMLGVFYDDFDPQDVEDTISDLKRKMAENLVPAAIIGEAESGYRLHGRPEKRG